MSDNDLEYLPPAGFELGSVAERLPLPLYADGGEDSESRLAFYDTFDLRLRDAGLRLAHEDGFLRLFGDGREVAALALRTPGEAIRPAELEPGPLRDRLEPVCDVRALLRLAQLESTRRVVRVLDAEGKTVVRLVAEDALLADGPKAGDALRPRLHVLAVRGYDKPFERVRRVVEDELGLVRATEALADEARARSGSSPASEADVELTPDLPADRAAVALSTRLLHVIEANLPGTLADVDSEFLHDLRVAVRRTRSLQRELKKVFPPAELDHFRQEFKWLQQVTGPSRDLDVYLLEFGDFADAVPESHRGGLELLRELLEAHRAKERGAMETALRSERATGVLRGWADFLERLPSLPVDDRPSAVTPIGEIAARRIAKVYRQMVRMGESIDDSSPHSDLHDLRKKGKELRYLLEFFSPLFSGKVTKPMVRTLKALQNTLGRFQDREVQTEMIRSLGPELEGRPGSAAALMAMGVLVERLEEQQAAARAEFSERFSAFSSADQRALVKKTFQ